MSLQETKIFLNGKCLIPKATIATSLFSRMKGLLGSKNLEVTEGLIINDCKQVHTFFMHYPIDVIFLNSEDEVLKISTLVPWRISSWVRHSKRVLEIPAGLAQRHGVKTGIKLELTT